MVNCFSINCLFTHNIILFIITMLTVIGYFTLVNVLFHKPFSLPDYL